jgi:hypothetical protein
MYLHEDGSLVVNGGGGGENLQLPWKMEIFRGDLGACILNLTPCLQLVLACRLPLSLFEDAYTICG